MSKQELVAWEQKMMEAAKESAKVETGGGNFISIRGGVLQYLGQPVAGNNMNVIVIASGGEHTYYDQAFDPDRIIPPKCFSVFPLDERSPAPHETVKDKQSESCAECWAHKFKSADNGRGRACSVRRRLVVIPASALKDENLTGAEVAMMKVPPTSVTNWSKYVNILSAQHQRPPFMVVTKVAVEPHPKWVFSVRFVVESLVDIENFPVLQGMSESAQQFALAPFDMTPPEEQKEPEKQLKGKKKTVRK